METTRAQAAAPTERGNSDAQRWDQLLVVALLVLAALRLVSLGRFGLWIDEAFTLHDAAEFSRGGSHQFPFGLAATWTAVQFFGPSAEWVLRLAPAVFGALGLIVCVWAFEPAVGRRRALVVALLVGMSSWHLFWSQSARGYTLALAVALLGAGLIVRACVHGSAVRFVLGLVTVALAGFAHPSGALLAPALAFGAYLADPRARRFAWRPPPWILAAVLVVAIAALGRWASSVWQAYVERKSGGNARHLLLTCGWYFTPLLGTSALGGAWLAWRRGSAIDALAAWVCCMVASAVLAASTRVVVSAQYMFVLLPWVALLATAPLFDQRTPRRVRRGLAVALLAYGVVDLTLYFTVRHGDRPRWNEAYAWVFEQRGRDDLIFGMAWPSGAFYLQPGDTELRVPTSMARLSAYHSTALAQWPRRARREWFVVNHEDLLAWNATDRDQLIAWLDEQALKVRTFSVSATPRNLAVDVYVRE